LLEKYNPYQYYNFLLEKGCIGFSKEGIPLKSGRISPYYVNLRYLTAPVSYILELTKYILSFAKDQGILTGNEVFYGVPEGATKTGVFAQLLNYEINNHPGVLLSDRNYQWLNIKELKNLVSQLFEQNKEKLIQTKGVCGEPFSIARELSMILAYYAFQKLGKDYTLILGRKKPKTHGMPQDRYFVGVPEGNILLLYPEQQESFKNWLSSIKEVKEIYEIITPINEKTLTMIQNSSNLILIEDVTTTGGSALKEIEELKKRNINVKAVIALFNRQEIRDDGKKVEEVFKEAGVKYYSMANASDILPLAIQSQKEKVKIIPRIQKYYSIYGTPDTKLDF